MTDVTGREFRIRKYLIAVCIIILLSWQSTLHGATTKYPLQAQDAFPVYAQIQPNVAFWIDIFTRYSKAQGVIHDTRDLSKVYGVITLNPANTRSAAKINRKIKEKALKRYRLMLLKLAKGEPPKTADEKRVARLFGPRCAPDHFQQAAYRLRIQTGLKNHFKEGVIRSGALVPEFKRIFNAHGLPEDLVYLPCVESSFNTAAYSKFGAAGIWQFTRSTGRLYMKIGYVVDERRDPFIATHGAARLLKKNYSELNNWPMAITAYNHGRSGMKRAKKKHKTYSNIYTHYRSRTFKFASRNFYSEFLAAREVAKNYTKYFGHIILDRPVSYSRFKVGGYLPAIDLARDLGLDLDVLRSMNPALRKPVFDGRKYIPEGFELRVPSHITNHEIALVAASLYKKEQKPSRFHLVQKGDTASAIARRHQVPLKDLILVNDLGRRATIYVGQTLRIPGKDETKPAASVLARAETESSGKTIKKRQSKPIQNKKEPAANRTLEILPQPEKRQPLTAGGISGSTVAERMTAAAKQNTSLSDVEQKAEQFVSPLLVNLKTVTADLKIQQTIQGKYGKIGVIHVAPEETLGHYADWLGIATQKIRNLNKLTYGRSISIGQMVKIPLPETGSGQFEEQRYEFHQEILEDFFDAFFVSDTRTYEIQSGDTVWLLCLNKLEIPLWLLQKYNPDVNFNRLHPGQSLVYPLVSSNALAP
jgi:membrane-bound lytic murein transglycosylase D